MNSVTPMVRLFGIVSFASALLGCGGSPETQSDTGEASPPVSVTAKLQYQVDSLMNENRRLQQQVDVMGTENRNLTAHAAELETKLNETATVPKAEPAASPSTSDVSYEGALAAFRKRDFTGSILGFQALLDHNVREDQADNCHYWIGESYYGMRQYKDAIDHFRMVLNYKGSEKRDAAQMMIANATALMGDKAGAREAYNTLISTYPLSPLLPKAKEKLARLK